MFLLRRVLFVLRILIVHLDHTVMGEHVRHFNHDNVVEIVIVRHDSFVDHDEILVELDHHLSLHVLSEEHVLLPHLL